MAGEKLASEAARDSMNFSSSNSTSQTPDRVRGIQGRCGLCTQQNPNILFSLVSVRQKVQRNVTFSAQGTQCRETDTFSSPLALATWRILETTVLFESIKALKYAESRTPGPGHGICDSRVSVT